MTLRKGATSPLQSKGKPAGEPVGLFGKAAKPTHVEPVPQLIADQPWWIALADKPRAEFHRYRERRLLKSDGKVSQYERFE